MIVVEKLFPTARKYLLILPGDARVTEAAALLGDKTRHLVVVCDTLGTMIGVVARSDIVREVSHCLGYACRMACRTIMTKEVVACRPADPLEGVWSAMIEKGLRRIPIVDELRHPLGLATARDTAQMMLLDVEYDQTVMKDYVMNMGYR